MKKNILKSLGMVGAFAFLLTGCATVGNIPASQRPNKDTFIYNGGNSVTVGDYVYFGNGYTPYNTEDTKTFDYKGSANVSYFSRINKNNLKAQDKDHSPDKVEKVSEKVIGYQNQDMFVYGNYVYFTSMNTHKNSSLENDYSLVSFFRCKLNGDKQKEIYTTSSFDSAKGFFSPVKGNDNKYYWVIFDGTTLKSVKLGDSLGKMTTIESNVESTCIQKANDEYSNKNIYYTIKSTDDNTDNSVYSFDFATGEKFKYVISSSEKITFVDRSGDNLFYTNTRIEDGSNYTYSNDISQLKENDDFFNGETKFYTTSSITDVQMIGSGSSFEGHIFTGGSSKTVMYKNKTSQVSESLISSDSYTNVLFVDNDRVYYSNDTGIYRISVKPTSGTNERIPETIVTMTSIVSGEYGFDGEYIYFYGGLEELEGQTDEEKEETKDENKYMYKVSFGGGDYQLIGQAKYR